MSVGKSKLLNRASLFVVSLSAVQASVAVAQEYEPGDIVVTAQKRTQNLQDVGVAVSALSGADLQKLGISDSKDIAKAMPGISLDATASGGVNAQLTVRGISQSDYSSVQESPNSIYIDDVYLSSSNEAAFPLYDLERVELLRGPQGTLFGRSSSGGLANFITARPSKSWEGYAELGYGSYYNAYAEAAISGPLSDRIRFRVSGRAETGNGWWRNSGGKDTFQKDFWGLRGQLEADLTDSLTARVVVSYDKTPKHLEGTYRAVPYYFVNGQPTPLPADVDAYGTGPGNDFAGYRNTNSTPQSGNFNNIGYLKNRRFSSTLNLNWDIGGATVTSITNYTNFSYRYNEDCDAGPVDLCQFPLGQDLKQESEELRINGTANRLTYTAGLYYLHITQDAPISFVFPSLAGSDYAFDDVNLIHQNLNSYAAFGQLEYALTDTLSVSVGGRYTHDRKTVDSKVYFNELGNGYSGGTGSVVFSPPLLVYDFSKATVGDLAIRKDNMWSGKAQLDYKPNRDMLFYASISRGTKGGGFNTNVSGNLTLEGTPFRDEHLYAYELGAKLQLFDRRVRLNLSAFDYDYHNFQGFAFNGLQGVVGNHDAYFRGGEVQLSANPMQGLNLSVGAAYLRSKLYDVPTAYSGVRDQQGVNAPRWSVNGLVSKDFEIGSNTLTVQWTGNYIGNRYASIDNNASTYVKGSFIHNARVTYHVDVAGVDISAFVNNISDVARQTYAFDLITSVGSKLISYDRPRWFGGSIRKTF